MHFVHFVAANANHAATTLHAWWIHFQAMHPWSESWT